MKPSFKNLAIGVLLIALAASVETGFGAEPEELWRSLEKLSPSAREKILIEGATNEKQLIWYTDTGLDSAQRYIHAFKSKYPFIRAAGWRAKPRQVTQRIIAEARDGRYLVDVIKPSAELAPALGEARLLADYESPVRNAYPGYSKTAYSTNLTYEFRVFSFNPRSLAREEAPKSWHDLLLPRWKGQIIFDEAALDEIVALLAVWGKEETVDYFSRFRRQQPQVRFGRESTTRMIMAGEAALAVTTGASGNERLKAQNLPIDWLAPDVTPTLLHPLTLARRAPHPYSAALFHDFLLSEEGQSLIAAEGRVVAHPNVEPIYPRLGELKRLLGTPRAQLNHVERINRFYNDALYILDQIFLKTNP